MNLQKLLLLFILFCLGRVSFAQELIAQVKINTPQLQKTDPKIFEELESTIADFLNNQTWTNTEYEPHEQIECNFQLTIREELDNNTFTADLAIQATRPVYGSDYKTPLISYLDREIRFMYTPSMPLEFSENGYIDNLSSILSFYALYIIGLDYDSFSSLGGTPYFEKAQSLINLIPPSESDKYPGWRPEGDINRYWMVENLLNSRVSDMRKSIYLYHRKGLDVMFSNVGEGQQIMLESLRSVKNTLQNYPDAMVIKMFVDAKSNEIIDVMAKSPRNLQRQVYAIMVRLDPANTNKYVKFRS